jgi:hypothetical protein
MQENFEKKTYFLLASCKLLMKKAGSGSVSQWHGSADPDLDPYKMSRIKNTGYKAKFVHMVGRQGHLIPPPPHPSLL